MLEMTGHPIIYKYTMIALTPIYKLSPDASLFTKTSPSVKPPLLQQILTDDELEAGAAHLSGSHQLKEAALEQLALDHLAEAAADEVRQRQLRRDGERRHHDRHVL